MHSLEINARVYNRSAADIYAALSDFGRYPECSSAVRSVRIDASEKGDLISAWETNFRGGILRWVEKDFFDPVAGTIRFEQTEGDIEHFTGTWTVKSVEDGGMVRFTAQFDMGMPSLSKILDPIAEHALRENITAIISGLFGPQVEILSDETT